MCRADYALECFNSNFNCSQSVLTAFCEEYGMDKETAFRISCGFGGGMGHIGEVCGAVTGAFMVIGMKYGQTNEEDIHSKLKTYLFVKNFSHRFKKLNGSINCTELLKCDLGNDKQLEDARQKNLFNTLCRKYVKDSVEILEELLLKEDII